MKNKINQKESRSICFLKYIGIAVGVVLLSSWSVKASSFEEQQEQTFKEITGVVKTEYGDPIPGVDVKLKGTIIEAETDIEGWYNLKANEGDKIQFVFEGFKTTTVTVGKSNILNVTMIEDGIDLTDITVDVYRTTSKETIGCVGAFYKPKTIEEIIEEQNVAPISTVTPEMFGCRFGVKDFISTLKETAFRSSISNKIIDQAVGLEITTGNNIPKAQTSLKDAEALTRNGNYTYIVDGVRVSEETFRSLNQNDIESVDIYKNSDITQALYGNKESQSKTTFKAR